ncbi:MAG: hypothetical protein KAT58_05390 [candidate division Zixibacteria bacterium]|nr:hypothetical protein [candidate division Zixibacteria bacterium]
MIRFVWLTVLACCLLLSIGGAVTASIIATGNFPMDRIESTDYIYVRYGEELRLVDSRRALYHHIQPQISYYVIPGKSGNPVDSIIACRFYQLRFARNSHLNRLTGIDGDPQRLPHLLLRLVPYTEEIAANDTSAIHRVGLSAETWFIPASNMQVHIRARLENHGELYSQFAGRIWKEKLTGWLDNAAFYYYKNGFFGSVGRSYLIWGPEERDALLISSNSPPFDRLWLGYEHKFLRFDYFLAQLDEINVADTTMSRYLVAHRLSLRKTGLFELGLSEVALFGSPNRSLEWHYLNPFLPYYWEQYNATGDDNILFGADLAIYWPRKCRIFAELVVDDFQIDFESEPHQVGYKIGFDALAPLGLVRLFTKLSYTRVNATVYGQNKPQNLYLHQDEPIGYFGGNDQDRLYALLRYHISPTFDAELELQYTRRGEGGIEPHDESAVPYLDKFPTGAVEKSQSISFQLHMFESHLLVGHLRAGYTHYENHRHIDGQEHDRAEIGIFLSYYLQGWLH